VGAQSAIAEPCGSEHKSPSRAQIIFQMLVLCLLLILLINYKGAAGLNKIRQTLTAGQPSVPALPIGVRAASMTAFRDAVGYVKIVWPAVVFGLLISAALRTSLSRAPLRRLFSGSSVRDQLAGALAGAPLMLCSCCVAPIFPAVYQRTRRLAPALALAPNEDLLASNGDAVNADPNHPNEIVEFSAAGQFVAEIPVDTSGTAGGAFGIALAKFGNHVRLAAVDDNLNNLEVWVGP